MSGVQKKSLSPRIWGKLRRLTPMGVIMLILATQPVFGLTLAQVMAWRLTAPSHYLNQCWLLISDSPESCFLRMSPVFFSLTNLTILLLTLPPHFPGTDELMTSNTLFRADQTTFLTRPAISREISNRCSWWRHRNIFRVTGLLWGESTGHRFIPLTKASGAKLWCILWYAPVQRWGKQSRRRWFETPFHSLWRHCNYMTSAREKKFAEMISHTWENHQVSGWNWVRSRYRY